MATLAQYQTTLAHVTPVDLSNESYTSNEDMRAFWQSVLSKDLPGTLIVPGGEIYERTRIHPYIKGNAVNVFEVTDLGYRRGYRGISIDEMKIESGRLGPLLIDKGIGLATIFLRNLIDGAKQKGRTEIHLNAGRADGVRYWSRRGFGFQEELYCTRCDFYSKVAEANKSLRESGKLPKAVADEVDRILAEPFHRLVNCKIASIDYPIGGTPAGILLMNGVTTEFQAYLDLADPQSTPYIDHIYNRATYYAEALRREQLKHGTQQAAKVSVLAAE